MSDRELVVEIDHIQGAFADFGWTSRLPGPLATMGLVVNSVIASMPLPGTAEPLTPEALQALMAAQADFGLRGEALSRGAWYLYFIGARAHPLGFMGLMFDFNFDDIEREGCAVFTDAIRAVEGVDSDTLLSRTALHEIGHVLNLVHPAAGSGDESVMVQTADLATSPSWPGAIRLEYSLSDQVFCQDHPDLCQPGNGVPFRGKFIEDVSVRRKKRRHRPALDVRVRTTSDAGRSAAYLGCPVNLLIEIENRGLHPRRIPRWPALCTGDLAIELLDRESGLARFFEVPYQGCGLAPKTRRIEPGQIWAFALPVFFDRRGFLFPHAGSYEVRVFLRRIQRRWGWMASEPSELEIVADPAVTQDLYHHIFDRELGKYVELGGSPSLRAAHSRAKRLIDELPPSPVSGTLLDCVSRARKRRALRGGEAGLRSGRI